MKTETPYFVYMLRCRDGSLYTGIAADVTRRLEEHTRGRKSGGAKYTAAHRPVKVEAVWACPDRSVASKLEYRIKALSKDRKELLIVQKPPLDAVFASEFAACVTAPCPALPIFET